ncbi:MAG: hypothetical protein PVJ28_09895 [Acidimicrobiia bacterium]
MTEDSEEQPDWLEAGSSSLLCRLEDATLVCSHLAVLETVDTPTDLTVSVDVGDRTFTDLASIHIVLAETSQVRVSGPGWTRSDWAGIFANVPQRLTVTRTADTRTMVWGLLRSWPDRTPVDSITLVDAGAADGRPEILVEEPGEYELVACAGDNPETCSADPSGIRLSVVEPALEPLVEGHNTYGKIDVVITGTGFASHDELVAVAQTLLDPEALPIVAETDDGRHIYMPLFTVEPLRSNTDHFNLWVMPDQFNSAPFLHCGVHHDDLDCPDDLDEEFLDTAALGLTAPTFIDLEATPYGWNDIPDKREGASFIAYSLDDPNWTTGPPTPPTDRTSWRLGHYAALGVETLRPWTADLFLLHEIGHSWFGLHEEYGDTEQSKGVPAPNCAYTQEQGRQQWGDLIGTIDPFAYEYQTLLEQAGIKATTDIPEAVEIGIHPGGYCAIKPSSTSIMEGAPALPIFGSVNRQWAEQIISLWD